MPKQISPAIKLRGAIDDISFYKTQDGFLARTKTSIDPERIRTHPNFKLTRQNGAEFGYAGKTGKLFRYAFLDEISKAADNRIIGRVTQTMVKVLQTDTVNVRGKRTVPNGDLSMLTDLQFNKDVPLGTIITAPFTTAIDRVTGQVTVSLQPFIPANRLAAPSGATHFRFITAAAAIDFANETTVTGRQVSADLPVNQIATSTINMVSQVPAGTTLPLFVVLGIEFLVIVNNNVDLMSKDQNPLQLIAVSKV